MEKLASTFDRDNLLDMLGLQVRTPNADYILPALALFGAGVVIGAGVGLLFALRPGRELREDLANRISHAPEALAALPHKAVELAQRASGTLSQPPDQAHLPSSV